LIPRQRLDSHIFLMTTADHENSADSVATTILRMNSSSQTMVDMFFMTPVDLSRAVGSS
jgi:hypothetical protein